MLPEKTPVHRAIKRPQVQLETGLSRSSIYAKLNPKCPQFDPDFPRPIKIGLRSIAWFESDIQKWLASRTGA